ncbi:unnamed protein product [Durusdinium trenchii]|uniref:Uncharacterized protein n=1 Tax=Durusdinium trenchii TaxID=1381693 RepID=A0ABP0J893_9DINO
MALLWGDSKCPLASTGKMQGTSDGDEENPNGSSSSKRRRRNRQPAGEDAAPTLPAPDQANANANANATPFSFLTPATTNKKAAQESRELDKAEALALQCNQLKLQFQDAPSVMQVTCSKVNGIMDKVDARLKDSTEVNCETVRRDGSGCRAERVWQNLKDSKSFLEAALEMVEALHDKEASPETMTMKVQTLKSMGVSLPVVVQSSILSRRAESMLESGKVAEIFEMPHYKNGQSTNDSDAGINAVVPSKENEETRNKIISDFQAACVTRLINTIFLKQFKVESGSTDDGAARKKFMDEMLEKLLSLVKAFQNSVIFDTMVEKLEAAKQNLLKPKGSFQSGMTIYPTGSYLSEQVAQVIGQFQQDQMLRSDMQSADETAAIWKTETITKDLILKSKDDDHEFCIPMQSKFYDMVAKLQLYKESASDRLKATDKSLEVVNRIDGLVDQMQSAVTAAVAFKSTQKFPKLLESFASLADGKMDEENAANFIQTLNGVVTYQPLRKVALAKLLGKDGASPLEKETASIGRLIACIKDALLKLRLLHGPSISESLLMDEHIKSLFASIHDDDLVNAFKKIVPTWSEIIERVDGLIQGAEAEFDYSKLCVAYVSHTPESTIELPKVEDGEKTVRVHLSFLAVAGCLLHLSKVMLAIKGTLEEADQLGAISEPITKERKGIKENGQIVTNKMDVFVKLCPFFAQMEKMVMTYQDLVSKVRNDTPFLEQEKDFYTSAAKTFRKFLLQGLRDSSNELSNIGNALSTLFAEVDGARKILNLFQSDPLDRDRVADLVKDDRVKLMLLMGTKASAFSKQLKELVTAMTSLPKGSLLTETLQKMVTAAADDLTKFSGAQNPQRMVEEKEMVTLGNFSWFQSSMTLAQCLTRNLYPSETRVGLASKCLVLLQKKGVQSEGALQRRVAALKAGK